MAGRRKKNYFSVSTSQTILQTIQLGSRNVYLNTVRKTRRTTGWWRGHGRVIRTRGERKGQGEDGEDKGRVG